MSMSGLRNKVDIPTIKDGWHFSYLGGADKIIEKIESFSHGEMDNDYFKNKEKIENHIKNGTDIFDREYSYEYVDIDDTYPPYIRENKKLLIEKGLINEIH